MSGGSCASQRRSGVQLDAGGTSETHGMPDARKRAARRRRHQLQRPNDRMQDFLWRTCRRTGARPLVRICPPCARRPVYLHLPRERIRAWWTAVESVIAIMVGTFGLMNNAPPYDGAWKCEHRPPRGGSSGQCNVPTACLG